MASNFRSVQGAHPEARTSLHPAPRSPFGLGPRACVGQKFALEEMKLATIEMLRRFRFEPMPGQKSSSEMPIRTGITMQPIEGIWIKATRLEQ